LYPAIESVIVTRTLSAARFSDDNWKFIENKAMSFKDLTESQITIAKKVVRQKARSP
jgi:hypothetical protein